MHELRFHESAEKEWLGLDKGVRDRLLKVLERRLSEPRVSSAALSSDLKGLYKIKLQKSGHRLLYEVFDDELVVLVIAVGKHGKSDLYRIAAERLD
ncbi:MAG: type II toxin-antitoxin system RelE/ParE family toxin [Actinobacteria bacterium]|nr:type II toxin-antitoxin system RelE/ParE family toxin [Actinomycetota bacterium]